MKAFAKIVLFIFSVAVGYYGTAAVTGIIFNESTETEISISDIEHKDTDNRVSHSSVDNKVKKPELKLEFRISEKKTESSSFGFKVQCINLPAGVEVIRYDLYDNNANYITHTGGDGIFENLSYSQDDNTNYSLCAHVADGRVSALQNIGAFKKPMLPEVQYVAKVTKMSVGELQGLIDNLVTDNGYKSFRRNERIASNVKFVGNGKSQDLIKFRLDIKVLKHVKVVSVKYDQNNKVSSVVYEVLK